MQNAEHLLCRNPQNISVFTQEFEMDCIVDKCNQNDVTGMEISADTDQTAF